MTTKKGKDFEKTVENCERKNMKYFEDFSEEVCAKY